jgi:YjjG family noncanonical pyrimidine nucleotidase
METALQTPRYPTVLLDLDHTLLDSDASERAAFAETVGSVGLEPTAELFGTYTTINRALWAAVERGETTPVALRVARFEQLVQAVGIDADPEQLADAFTAGLANNGELYPGARTTLDALAESHRLGLVTNGLSEVQRPRLERLDIGRYFDAVVISAEVGTSKPGTDIFDIIFADMDEPDRAGVLMVGDSLTSDMQGGANAGLDTCWYNPHGTPPPAEDSAGPWPSFEIKGLEELPAVAAGQPR